MPLPFRYLLIDLDDTLAPEWDYVAGGYRAAAELLSQRTGKDSSVLFNQFVYEHMKYGRYRIMDRMASIYQASPDLAKDLIDAYRHHLVNMHFYPGVEKALRQLVAKGCRLAVVTDGSVDMQRRKVASLGLADLVEVIVYCLEWNAPKPSSKAFQQAMFTLGAEPAATIVVGDDPFHDLQAAAALGLRACRVRTGRFATIDNPDAVGIAELKTFAALPNWLHGESA